MIRYIVAFVVVVSAGFYLMDDSSAMKKCQEKYSYGTCVKLMR